MLNNRSNNLDKREDNLALKELKLDEKKAEIDILNSKVEELLVEQEQRLVEISGMSVEQARWINENVEEAMSDEITAYLKDREEEAMNEADMKAKELLTLATKIREGHHSRKNSKCSWFAEWRNERQSYRKRR